MEEIYIFIFADTRTCQPQKTHLVEKSAVSVSAFCTEKPQILNPFQLQRIYRVDKVCGIYRMLRKESHICYEGQVLPNMTNLAQLSGGRYYELVQGTE